MLHVIFKFATSTHCTVDAPIPEKDRHTQFQRLLSDEMQRSDVRIADALLADVAPQNFRICGLTADLLHTRSC